MFPFILTDQSNIIVFTFCCSGVLDALVGSINVVDTCLVMDGLACRVVFIYIYRYL